MQLTNSTSRMKKTRIVSKLDCFKGWESNDTFQYILETLVMNHLQETCIFQRNWEEVKNELQDWQICTSAWKHYKITEFKHT